MLAINAKIIRQVIAPSAITLMLCVYVVIGSSFACASKTLDSTILLQEIEKKGAEYVYNNELSGPAWLTFLEKVETGEKAWLEVAAAIYLVTDGGPSEDLTMAAGVALPHYPREVLLILAPTVGAEWICDYSEMTMAFRKLDTRQQVLADIDARINAVRALSNSDVGSLQSKCVDSLEKAKQGILGPYGPFPKSE